MANSVAVGLAIVRKNVAALAAEIGHVSVFDFCCAAVLNAPAVLLCKEVFWVITIMQTEGVDHCKPFTAERSIKAALPVHSVCCALIFVTMIA